MRPRSASRLSPIRPSASCDHFGCAGCRVEFCKYAKRIAEAIQLVRLGARSGLVCQLTGLEKTPANRLVRQLCGSPSPPGQMPFSDAWYLRSDVRMLHATVVWRLHQRLTRTGRSAARILIDVFETYCQIVADPLLDFTRAVFVPRLVAMEIWEERSCHSCKRSFLTRLDDITTECPGCRLYHRHRCRTCDSPLETHATGRQRSICLGCLARAKESPGQDPIG